MAYVEESSGEDVRLPGGGAPYALPDLEKSSTLGSFVSLCSNNSLPPTFFPANASSRSAAAANGSEPLCLLSPVRKPMAAREEEEEEYEDPLSPDTSTQRTVNNNPLLDLSLVSSPGGEARDHGWLSASRSETRSAHYSANAEDLAAGSGGFSASRLRAGKLLFGIGPSASPPPAPGVRSLSIWSSDATRNSSGQEDPDVENLSRTTTTSRSTNATTSAAEASPFAASERAPPNVPWMIRPAPKVGGKPAVRHPGQLLQGANGSAQPEVSFGRVVELPSTASNIRTTSLSELDSGSSSHGSGNVEMPVGSPALRPQNPYPATSVSSPQVRPKNPYPPMAAFSPARSSPLQSGCPPSNHNPRRGSYYPFTADPTTPGQASSFLRKAPAYVTYEIGAGQPSKRTRISTPEECGPSHQGGTHTVIRLMNSMDVSGSAAASTAVAATPTKEQQCAQQVASMQSCTSGIVDSCHSAGVKLVVLDWDLTLVEVDTHSAYQGGADRLAKELRSIFVALVPGLLSANLYLGIATFSSQVELIEDTLLAAFQHYPNLIRFGDNVFVRGAFGKGRGSGDAGAARARLARCDSSHWDLRDEDNPQAGKRPHMRDITGWIRDKHAVNIEASEILYVDDNGTNVSMAQHDGVRTVRYPLTNGDWFPYLLSKALAPLSDAERERRRTTAGKYSTCAWVEADPESAGPEGE